MMRLRRRDFPIAIALRGSILILGVCALLSRPSLAQSPQGSVPQNSSMTAPASQSPEKSETPEMTTHESNVPFRVRTNLVPIRVVVHDSHGRAVANLTKDDFRVLDDGKPQTISNFVVETPTTLAKQAVRPASNAEPAELTGGLQLPTRFVAFLFDDAHLRLEDLMQIKIAADHFLDTSIQATDRAAVFTVSEQSQLDFTDDHSKLRDTLFHVMPHSVTGLGTASDPAGGTECPPMDYYEADQIANKDNRQALDLATQDTLYCEFKGDHRLLHAAADFAAMRVSEVNTAGYTATQYAFRRLEEVVRRIAALPGQRIIIFISPGFIYPTHETELSQIIDQATHANVFINTLDARGLYTAGLGDASQPYTGSPAMVAFANTLRLQAQSEYTMLLDGLADGTGGFAFRNNNDFDAGLRMTAAAPEISYLLGFTPQNLKNDGKFHNLKVTVFAKGSYSVQARHGYFAPRHGATPAEVAEQDIEEAVFSQEELNGLPVGMKTQFYKTGPSDAKLAVLTHVDIAHVQFQKEEGRNRNDLVIVTALFDRNGNFISGNKEIVELRLHDATLERLSRTGITLKSNLDVKPGAYLVRLVVRDSNSALLSAQNGVVEIPY
jgi:VWFA-related protein